MAILIWKPDYSVGIKEIDEQHMTIIVLINELYDGLKNGRGKQIVVPVLNELAKYTSYHFDYEEELLDKYEYPEKELHKRQHQDLVARILAYKSSYENDVSVFTIEIMNFLKSWFVNHIAESDKRYTSYLNSKGVV